MDKRINVEIRLDSFEGPMDLLYSLIIKNKIDINDIPIALITDQYLECINRYEAENRDVTMTSMSDFIVMAATLIEIKSKMLLPKEVDENNVEIDPREELVKRLIEYKRFKKLAVTFGQKQLSSGFNYYKKSDSALIKRIRADVPKQISDILGDADMAMLMRAFEDVLKRQEVRTDKIRSRFNSVEREQYTIESKTEYILNLLEVNGSIYFRSMFRYERGSYRMHKSEIIATFLAMLELIKTKQIRVYQDKAFDDIKISSYKEEVKQQNLHDMQSQN
jgi:segregation and condensation protein A